jgi:hypothetical protein
VRSKSPDSRAEAIACFRFRTPSLRHTCIELALDLACTPITGRLAVADGPSRPFGG